MKDWSEIELKFRRYVARRGVRDVAEKLHVDRTTVYRLIAGQSKPQPATRIRIEQEVAGEDQPHEHQPRP